MFEINALSLLQCIDMGGLATENSSGWKNCS